MPDIPFTQYLRPDGRKTYVTINRPEEISSLADKIIDRGYRFECEHLISGHVSFTISDDEDDHDITLVENGPRVPEAIDMMIKGFAARIGVS